MNIPENGSLFLYQSYFRVTEQLLRICSENITTSDHTSNPTSILSNQGDLPFDITNTYCQVDHHQNETTKLSKVTFKKEVHIKQITDTTICESQQCPKIIHFSYIRSQFITGLDSELTMGLQIGTTPKVEKYNTIIRGVIHNKVDQHSEDDKKFNINLLAKLGEDKTYEIDLNYDKSINENLIFNRELEINGKVKIHTRDELDSNSYNTSMYKIDLSNNNDPKDDDVSWLRFTIINSLHSEMKSNSGNMPSNMLLSGFRGCGNAYNCEMIRIELGQSIDPLEFSTKFVFKAKPSVVQFFLPDKDGVLETLLEWNWRNSKNVKFEINYGNAKDEHDHKMELSYESRDMEKIKKFSYHNSFYHKETSEMEIVYDQKATYCRNKPLPILNKNPNYNPTKFFFRSKNMFSEQEESKILVYFIEKDTKTQGKSLDIEFRHFILGGIVQACDNRKSRSRQCYEKDCTDETPILIQTSTRDDLIQIDVDIPYYKIFTNSEAPNGPYYAAFNMTYHNRHTHDYYNKPEEKLEFTSNFDTNQDVAIFNNIQPRNLKHKISLNAGQGHDTKRVKLDIKVVDSDSNLQGGPELYTFLFFEIAINEDKTRHETEQMQYNAEFTLRENFNNRIKCPDPNNKFNCVEDYKEFIFKGHYTTTEEGVDDIDLDFKTNFDSKLSINLSKVKSDERGTCAQKGVDQYPNTSVNKVIEAKFAEWNECWYTLSIGFKHTFTALEIDSLRFRRQFTDDGVLLQIGIDARQGGGLLSGMFQFNFNILWITDYRYFAFRMTSRDGVLNNFMDISHVLDPDDTFDPTTKMLSANLVHATEKAGYDKYRGMIKINIDPTPRVILLIQQKRSSGSNDKSCEVLELEHFGYNHRDKCEKDLSVQGELSLRVEIMKNRVWNSYLCNWKTGPKKVF